MRFLGGALPGATGTLWRRSERLNQSFGEGVASGLAAVPHGHLAPSAWVLPRKPGAMSAYVGTSLDFSASGNAAGGVNIDGTAPVVLTADATLIGKGLILGSTSAPSFSTSGILKGVGVLQGSASYAYLAAATGIGAGVLQGAASYSFDTSGIAYLVASAVGSASYSLTTSGLARAVLTAQGAASYAFASTGLLRGVGAFTGTASYSLTASGTIRAVGFLIGHITPFTELSPQSLAAAVWAALVVDNVDPGSMGERLNTAGFTPEQSDYLLALAKVHGLVPGVPLVVTATTREAGDLNQTISESGGTVTVERV